MKMDARYAERPSRAKWGAARSTKLKDLREAHLSDRLQARTRKEDPIMAEQRIISADSHFVEPPNMWAERIDKKFRDRAPHIVKGLHGREGEFFVCENISPIPVAAAFGAGVPSEQLPEHNKKGFEAAPPSVWDPAARLKDQDLDGVQAEVIYTTLGMPLYGLDEAELRAACFRAYNDWAVEYCSYDPKRLLPLGLITLEDIAAGVEELKRIEKKGMRGAMIWAEPPEDQPYSHPDYNPVLGHRAGLEPAFVAAYSHQPQRHGI